MESSTNRGVGAGPASIRSVVAWSRSSLHRLFGDLRGRSGSVQAAHQLRVVFFDPRFFLLEPVEHDALIGELLDPAKRRAHGGRIGRVSGHLLNALGPAGGVAIFAFREAEQDVAAPVCRFRARRGCGTCRPLPLRAATFRAAPKDDRVRTHQASSDDAVQHDDRADAGTRQHELAERLRIDPAAVKIGNQIGHGDIQKARRGHRQDVLVERRQPVEREHRQHGAERWRTSPDTMFSISALRREYPALQQDGEVAELLRNFVRRHRERRADAERNRRQHRRADDDAVEKIVKRVADTAPSAPPCRALRSRACDNGATTPAFRAGRTA